MARSGHGIMATHTHVPGNAGFQWLGDAGAGGNGDWNTAADWSRDAVPGASATATFATGGEFYTVTGDATIGAILVNGDAVTFDGALTQGAGGPGDFLSGVNGADVTLDANALSPAAR